MTQLILFNVTNGLIIGAFYVLMALGLSLILNLSNVINFSHGNFLALGGYMAYTLSPTLGYWGALLVSPPAAAAAGAVVALAPESSLQPAATRTSAMQVAQSRGLQAARHCFIAFIYVFLLLWFSLEAQLSSSPPQRNRACAMPAERKARQGGFNAKDESASVVFWPQRVTKARGTEMRLWAAK